MEISCYSSSIQFKEISILIYNKGYIHWDANNSNLLVLNLECEYIVDALLRKDQVILEILSYLTKRRNDLKIITEFNNPSSDIIDLLPHLLNEYLYELNEKIEFTLHCDLSTDEQRQCAIEVRQYLNPILQRKKQKKIKSFHVKKRRSEFQNIRHDLFLLLIDRDGYICKICSRIENIQIDHIVPLSKGGTDDIDNLQLLCASCNVRKSDKT